jgi:trans-aconitate methyltransferase
LSSVPSRGELYDWEQRNVIGRGAQDLAFYAELTRPGTQVLELACGTGRLSVPLARQGARVVGLDVDASMLAVAQRREPSLCLMRADMRRFALHRRFDLVVAAYNCLQLLLTDGDRRACVQAAARHLAPSGVLAVEVRDFLADGTPADVESEPLHTGPLGDSIVTLHGGLRHDVGPRVTTYTRRFEVRALDAPTRWVDDDVSLYSFEAGELDDLMQGAGLAGTVEVAGNAVERWVARRMLTCET